MVKCMWYTGKVPCAKPVDEICPMTEQPTTDRRLYEMAGILHEQMTDAEKIKKIREIVKE